MWDTQKLEIINCYFGYVARIRATHPSFFFFSFILNHNILQDSNPPFIIHNSNLHKQIGYLQEHFSVKMMVIVRSKSC